MKEVPHELIEACIRGKRKAQTEMYTMVFPVLMSMSRRYFRNYEDCVMVVNNGYMKILDSLPHYEKNGVFEAWCRRLMTNTIIDEVRKNKRWNATMIPLETTHESASHPELNNTEERYTSEQLETMLMQLPDATRCVFNLFAIEGYRHQEIAVMLKISEGTSKWHVSKAREDLKKMLKMI
jgi:RNA polymerase sigma factor (sigma-70 family)